LENNVLGITHRRSDKSSSKESAGIMFAKHVIGIKSHEDVRRRKSNVRRRLSINHVYTPLSTKWMPQKVGTERDSLKNVC
jgi:hypothetical protein